MTRDLEAFRGEFPGDAARDIAVETTGTDGGFVVCRPEPAAVSLTVAPNLAAVVDFFDAHTKVPKPTSER